MNYHDPKPEAGWTDARVETLKRLYAEGYSSSQIAVELGGVSRNGVIGKVHRLKLTRSRRAPSRASSANARAARQFTRKPLEAAPKVQKEAPKVRVENPVVPIFGKAPHKPRSALRTILDHLDGIPYLETTNSTCKWPLWADDTPIDDYRCCGAKTVESGPYCRLHTDRAKP